MWVTSTRQNYAVKFLLKNTFNKIYGIWLRMAKRQVTFYFINMSQLYWSLSSSLNLWPWEFRKQSVGRYSGVAGLACCFRSPMSKSAHYTKIYTTLTCYDDILYHLTYRINKEILSKASDVNSGFK